MDAARGSLWRSRMNLREKAEDLYDAVMDDPKKRTIFIAVCAFVIGFMVGHL